MVTQKSPIAISLTKFITGLFHNFTRLMYTNLLFGLPTVIFFAIFWVINTFTGINSIFILFLATIPSFPLYAGVVQVTSHMARGEEEIDVLSNFKAGVKENYKRFLVHGTIFYAALIFGYYSILLYSSFGKTNSHFFVFLAFSIAIAIFFLFAFYYIPSMTVTFDMSMKHIYKNSALMTFGELKNNIIATFGLIVLLLLCATILFCCYVPIAVIIASIILGFLVVPSIASFIINSAVYKPMYTMIVDSEQKSKEIDKKMENRRKGQFYDDIEKIKPDITQGFDNVQIDADGDADEYIYHNGRMVKRSVLLKMKKEVENAEVE